MANHLYDLLRSGAKDPRKDLRRAPRRALVPLPGRRRRLGALRERARRPRRRARRPRRGPGREVARGDRPLSRHACAPAPSSCRSTPPTRAAELEYFLGDAEPALFVCDRRRRDALRPIAATRPARGSRRSTPTGDGARWPTLGRRRPPRRFDDVAARPRRPRRDPLHLGHHRPLKGAMLTHDNLASNAATLVDTWRFTPRRRAASTRCRSSTPTGCSSRRTRCSLAGAAMIFLPKFDADAGHRGCCRARP